MPIDVRYASRRYRLGPDALDGDVAVAGCSFRSVAGSQSPGGPMQRVGNADRRR